MFYEIYVLLESDDLEVWGITLIYFHVERVRWIEPYYLPFSLPLFFWLFHLDLLSEYILQKRHMRFFPRQFQSKRLFKNIFSLPTLVVHRKRRNWSFDWWHLRRSNMHAIFISPQYVRVNLLYELPWKSRRPESIL